MNRPRRIYSASIVVLCSDHRCRRAQGKIAREWDMNVRAVVLAALVCAFAKPGLAADATLIESAKKEGKVVWYTTLIVNQAIRPLKEAFERKYPGIELQYARADESPTAAKILAEAQAGRLQADVFDGISNMVPLKRAGIVAPYVPSSAGLIAADMKDKDGYWIAILLYVFSPGKIGRAHV